MNLQKKKKTLLCTFFYSCPLTDIQSKPAFCDIWGFKALSLPSCRSIQALQWSSNTSSLYSLVTSEINIICYLKQSLIAYGVCFVYSLSIFWMYLANPCPWGMDTNIKPNMEYEPWLYLCTMVYSSIWENGVFSFPWKVPSNDQVFFFWLFVLFLNCCCCSFTMFRQWI